MFARDLHPPALLRRLLGTPPLRAYCAARGIPFAEAGGPPAAEFARWAAAVRTLPADGQARVELELAQVNELAGRDGNAHLEEAAGPDAAPPADVPGGPALALWVLLNYPDVFHQVFLHHEVREARAWRTGRAAAVVPVDDPAGAAAALADRLRGLFRVAGGAGRFCAVDARRLPDAVCFAVHLADRLRLVDGFTDGGERAVARVRPALTVLFAYRPADGTVLVKSPLRAADRVGELFRLFGEAVLGAPARAVGDAFDLDRLKRPFRPLPDAPDVEAVRVRALHLAYPARLGRRRVKLETLAGDAPAAVDELLAAHAGGAVPLDDLRVSYAELEVRVRAGGRPKALVVRLWPDRCSLNHTPLAARLRACLRAWGLARA